MLHLSKMEALVNVIMCFASPWHDLQTNYLRWKFLFRIWNGGPTGIKINILARILYNVNALLKL